MRAQAHKGADSLHVVQNFPKLCLNAGYPQLLKGPVKVAEALLHLH